MATNTSPAPVSDTHATPGEYTHAQVLTILSGLMMGLFLASLDQTIVSTAIRTIADDLDGLSIQAWATTAYLITATITTPIYGKLGDLYGRKKLFIFAITVFVLGSALCSFATSMYQLAAFRAFQGLGAGGLATLVLAIIGDIVSPRERAKYSGYFMAVFATSSVLGPVVGGFFAGRAELLGMAGWRWVFLVNVPVGIIALVVVLRTLHVHYVRPSFRIRVDWWGAILLTVGLVPLLTIAEQGRDWGWGSGRAIACFVVGGAGLVAFYLVQRAMGSAALIPLRLFRLRSAAITLGASVLVGAAMFGGIMLLPLYMQIVHGASPTGAGLLMLPMVLGMMTAGIGSGRLIARTGVIRPFPIIGTAIITVALLLLSFATADTDLVWVDVAMFLLGIGLGNCMQPLLLIMQSAVPPADIGVATSSATFFRQIGGTIGVAFFLSLLFSTVGANISDSIAQESRTPAWQQLVAEGRGLDPQVVGEVQSDSSFIDDLDPVLAHPFKVGFADSMDLVFRGAAGISALAFLVLLLMPAVELRATSAQAAVRGATGASPAQAPTPRRDDEV